MYEETKSPLSVSEENVPANQGCVYMYLIFNNSVKIDPGLSDTDEKVLKNAVKMFLFQLTAMERLKFPNEFNLSFRSKVEKSVIPKSIK